MTVTSYIPLTVHSHFSLLESAIKVPDLIKRAKELGLPALGLTDSGVMYGAVEFYNGCKAADIKPIIGSELFLIDGDITDRKNRSPWHHLTLICKNYTGYQNLVKLVSTAQVDGFYYKPRINWELLAEHNEGLIALSGDLTGIAGRPFLRGDSNGAWDNVRRLKAIFTPDSDGQPRCYLELQDHGKEGEQRLNAELVKIAQAEDLPLVVSNNDRFLNAGEEEIHNILLCMQEGKTIHESSKAAFFGPEYYLKTAEQMQNQFRNLPADVVEQAFNNTVAIAEQCDLHLPQGTSILPEYPLPEGVTEEEELYRVVIEHAKKRYGEELSKEVLDRLDYELGIINQMGFPAYFLITWEFINWSRENGIPVGPGRGSAAGSLVAYVLGITNLDPLEHKLLFERFLNPERVSMPDIDIDFCIERREDVINHVRELYGAEKVCQICTFGTLAAKASLKAVGRVLDIPFAESDRLAKMIPATVGTKLKDALEDGQPLKEEVEKDPDVKHLVDLALKLEGTACNLGVHAAGVVIAKDPLMDTVPIQRSKDGQLVSQYPMGDLEKLGLLKMDFLGLRNLTIIHNTCTMVADKEGNAPDMDTIPLDDPDVYKMLSAGDTDGVFQLESGGMKALERDLKPSVFEDINALVALFRPGPLNSGMAKSFVDRKHGREEIKVPHEDIEGVLESTYGTIVYQEQIMQVAQILAGYSLGRADLLRRAMGKKKAEVMAKERDGFVEGCTKNGVDEGVANKLFDTMSEFAAYCFNRSHSAAYAFVAYQTAWLKVHYPVEYLSALLSSVKNDLDKIQYYILTARRMDIRILPPDVGTSGVNFTPDYLQNDEEGNSVKAIRFGLASVKNVGTGVVEDIIAARQEAPFSDLDDFFKRAGKGVLNTKTLESLIHAGALDGFGYTRKQLFENTNELINFAQQHQQRAITGQNSLFDLMAASPSESADTNFGGIILTGDASEYEDEVLQKLEKDLLGFYVSSHPLDSMVDTLPLVISQATSDLKSMKDGSPVKIGGLVGSVQTRQTRTGKTMMLAQLEDFTGPVELVVFGRTVDAVRDQLLDGSRLLVKGKLSYRGDDSYSVIVDEVKPLSLISPLNLAFHNLPTFDDVALLREILQANRGELPVLVNFPDGSQMKLGQPFWIADREMVNQQLSKLLPITSIQ